LGAQNINILQTEGVLVSLIDLTDILSAVPDLIGDIIFSPYSKKRKRSAIAKNIENIPDDNIEKFAKSIIPKKRRPSLILFIVGAGLSLFSLAIFIFTIYLYFEYKTLDSTDIAGLIMYPILIACGIVGMRVGGWPYMHFRLQGFTYRNKPFKSTHLQYDEILGYTYVQEPKEKITLYHKNNNVTLSIGSQDFSYLMSQIIFRQTHGRWAVMNAREDLREIIYIMDDTIYAPWLINHPKAMFS